MSTPIDPATVANVPVGAATANVADKAEEHTPTPPPPPPAENIAAHVPDPTDGDGGRESATDGLSALAERLQTLEAAVIGLQKPDTPPVKKVPWTKKGKKK